MGPEDELIFEACFLSLFWVFRVVSLLPSKGWLEIEGCSLGSLIIIPSIRIQRCSSPPNCWSAWTQKVTLPPAPPILPVASAHTLTVNAAGESAWTRERGCRDYHHNLSLGAHGPQRLLSLPHCSTGNGSGLHQLLG